MDNCLICYRPLYEYIKVETENGEEERRLKINHRACWNSTTMILERQIFANMIYIHYNIVPGFKFIVPGSFLLLLGLILMFRI